MIPIGAFKLPPYHASPNTLDLGFPNVCCSCEFCTHRCRFIASVNLRSSITCIFSYYVNLSLRLRCRSPVPLRPPSPHSSPSSPAPLRPFPPLPPPPHRPRPPVPRQHRSADGCVGDEKRRTIENRGELEVEIVTSRLTRSISPPRSRRLLKWRMREFSLSFSRGLGFRGMCAAAVCVP